MTTRRYNNIGITSKGPSKNDVDYNVIVNTIPHIIQYASDSILIVSDIKYNHHIGSSYYNTYDLNIEPITNNINGDITYTSLNPTIATIDENGVTTRIADGTADILVSHPWLKRKESLDHTQYYSEVADTFDSWYSDSLAYDCYTNVNTRLSDANASIAKKIYSVQNHASSIYVRNSDFWASDLDISCVSPYNTTSSVYRAGTLISPRHIIMANHYAQSVGKSIRFVDMACNVYNRTLTAVTRVGSTDIAIGCLNSVISDVSFAKVLPENINDYLPNLSLGIPVAYTDQEEKGLVGNLYSLGNFASYKTPYTDSYINNTKLWCINSKDISSYNRTVTSFGSATLNGEIYVPYNSYVTCGDNFENLNTFSLLFTVRFDNVAASPAKIHGIFTTGLLNNQGNVTVYYKTDSPRGIILYIAGTTGNVIYRYDTGTVGYVDFNNTDYYRFCILYDKNASNTQKFKLYINGVQTNLTVQADATTDLPTGNRTICLGNLIKYISTDFALNGKIKDIRLLNTIVNENFISNDYNDYTTSLIRELAFYEIPVTGDSGNPCFLIINDEPVLVSCWYTANSGQNISNYFSDINDVMWNMSSDYKLTSIDLSSFPTY